MTYQDPKSRDMRNEPREERLQVDPTMRRTGMSFGWGWAIVVVVAVLAFIVVLYGTNHGTTNVAQGPGTNPPLTSGSAGPTPPATTPTSPRGTAAAPPASTNASRAPAAGGQTTGSGQ